MPSSNPTVLPDIPYSPSKGQPTPTLPPSIVVDAPLPTLARTPIASTTVLAFTNTTPRASEQVKSSIASPDNNLTNGELTAVIVVPIVLLAILSPILIVWFLSWRRRKRNRSRRSTPQKIILLEDEKENSSMGTPPQERSKRRSSATTRNTASLPPPPRPPRKDLEQRRSAQQFSTAPMPVNTDLSGFNFDFSRRASVRASVFSALSTQQPGEDPNFRPTRPPRPSSTHTWNIFPPTPSPVAIATPYFPPQKQNPKPPEKQANNINPVAPLSPPISEALPTLSHPNMYGNFHTSSSPRPLNDENLSVHNSSNYPKIVSSYPPHLDAVSEISGLSFDHDLWAASQRPTQEMGAVSEMSVQEEKRPSLDINPHQIV